MKPIQFRGKETMSYNKSEIHETMTEKERAREFLIQHRISGADFVYTTGFDNMVGLLEAYAAQQSKMSVCCPVCGGNGMVPNGFYDTVTGVALTASIIPETCRACNGSGVFVQQSKMPTKETVEQYFNNHSNCYTDVIIGDSEFTEPAMTIDAVLKLVEWLRNQIENR